MIAETSCVARQVFAGTLVEVVDMSQRAAAMPQIDQLRENRLSDEHAAKSHLQDLSYYTGGTIPKSSTVSSALKGMPRASKAARPP